MLVRLVNRSDRYQNDTTAVVRIFGSSNRAKYCADAVLCEKGIKLQFDEETLREAEKLRDDTLSAEEIANRLDLRNEIICTIDSKETKDIDDSISIKQEGDKILLGVHIADVSHYVRPGTALDNEAFERATSVYYANSVIPMLPVELSNGVCSLNEGVDRFALSCLMTLDMQGNIVDYRFAKSVIHSAKKCAYDEVNKILDNTADEELLQEYQVVLPTLRLMADFASVLRKKRFESGSMNIESSEAKIIVDKNGDPVDIVPRHSGVSENMIEEYMLLANECAANLGRVKELPFVYRVHEEPDPERLQDLATILKSLGYPYLEIKPGCKPKVLANILDLSRGKSEQLMVHRMVLRSMAKAKYMDEALGHYSIDKQDYAHFTSPIRRYPDLMIHRIISEYLSDKSKGDLKREYTGVVKAAAEQSSKMEINAMGAERDVEDCYKAQYMSRFINEELEGVVSGVAPYGYYVELPNTCEGLVRTTGLPDDFELVDDVRLVGKASGRVISIGDNVQVKIIGTNVALGQVDMADPATVVLKQKKKRR